MPEGDTFIPKYILPENKINTKKSNINNKNIYYYFILMIIIMIVFFYDYYCKY